MTGHIDQLAEWWENAERGAIRAGDTVIQNHHTAPDEYTVYVAEQPSLDSGACVRILARAPEPKPAWHDAIAVIAWTDLAERQVWERAPDGTYSGSAGDEADGYELRDVTPLVEAKVTDEMAVTALDYYYEVSPGSNEWHDSVLALMRRALAAALGLEAA